MAKFMDVHTGFIGVTAEQLEEAHGRDLAIEADGGCTSNGRGSIPRQGASSAWRPDPRRRRSCASTSVQTNPTG
jgi:hypothetical protein